VIKILNKDKNILPEEFLKRKRNPVFVILDNLRSAYNVGAIFRTCDAFLVKKMYLCGITAHPPNTKLRKTAMSSESYVRWEYARETVDVIHSLQDVGVRIYCCERTEQSKKISNIEFHFPCGIVFGNEAEGVSQKVIEASDEVVEIPMMGFKNSLNVATTVGIVLYEAVSKNT